MTDGSLLAMACICAALARWMTCWIASVTCESAVGWAGAVADGLRGYSGLCAQNCAGAATIDVTIVVGPLNYLGVNPKIKCELPQPSS